VVCVKTKLIGFVGRGGLRSGREEKKGQFNSTWKLMREEKRKTEPWEDKLSEAQCYKPQR